MITPGVPASGRRAVFQMRACGSKINCNAPGLALQIGFRAPASAAAAYNHTQSVDCCAADAMRAAGPARDDIRCGGRGRFPAHAAMPEIGYSQHNNGAGWTPCLPNVQASRRRWNGCGSFFSDGAARAKLPESLWSQCSCECCACFLHPRCAGLSWPGTETRVYRRSRA